ncbi:bifunctional adenosylcobinamide kinase/adenosylcobinamide-phosphate guanylyltransferase [Rhodobacteraceae bacterium RKSG542]|uniref:bifunctional adenosylcobinamide kinase/adenosylcobinamide-phosphate guanylyltransferase n=1 Tax=Pseudovibrio flavus TaxID=2529854 RepID=UPI0012BBAA41|nr:bifunctional adenosylcobinamide kinase/adenosylcobinamide-phosphate guanylyltransferase [Pseudovibrio flavus]MTI17312.1 bifunctional adenosylcobinamide kinase/adenosylcobinamide-phosphate guanylyltransferase [Pseudovibrio flavus]
MSAVSRANKVLVLGGARSGKSRYAEQLVRGSGRPMSYIATAQAFDDEMCLRISKHQTDRGEGWLTIEEPLELVSALREADKDGRAVLVDCLTLWLSNLMHAERSSPSEFERLAKVVGELSCPVVFVSNEVGLGIVPENALARAFRDEAGRLNQRLGEVCDHVVFVAGGLPMQLKPSLSPPITL